MSFSFLDRRSSIPEMMDDRSIQDTRLTGALSDLIVINRWLGGFATSVQPIARMLENYPADIPFRILDIGCGGGDFAVQLLNWANRCYPGHNVKIISLDYSPATVKWAREYTSKCLPKALIDSADFVCGDAFNMQFESNSFEIAHCALFAHHFNNDRGTLLLREMVRVSRLGIVVNDLHRNPVAFWSIFCLTRWLRASEMVQNDAPLSVRRAFTRDQLRRIAAASGLTKFQITWHWAFRWLLTTEALADA